MLQSVEDGVKVPFAQKQIWLRGTMETEEQYMLVYNYKDKRNDSREGRDYDGWYLLGVCRRRQGCEPGEDRRRCAETDPSFGEQAPEDGLCRREGWR